MIAIDTNVFIYGLDVTNPLKRQAANDLIGTLQSSGETVTLWQVLSEFTNCVRRLTAKGILPQLDLVETVGRLVEMFPIAIPHHTTVLSALDLSQRFYLSHWDSMLLAACIEAGVTTLYSEDLSHGTKYDTVQVVNPSAS